LHTKFGDYRFSLSGDMIAGIEIENGSYDPDHASLRVVCHPELGLHIVYLCVKFDDSSFSRSGDITGAPKI